MINKFPEFENYRVVTTKKILVLRKYTLLYVWVKRSQYLQFIFRWFKGATTYY